jgi:hypothetical protein
MAEVGGARVSIALVLSAVFIPAAFLSDISGEFFKQFAVTIAAATLISLFNSLTLSPALASLILKRHVQKDDAHPAPKPPGRIERGLNWFFARFNAGFERTARRYGRTVSWILGHRRPMVAVYLVLIAAPKGFIPAQDRGYVIVSVQLPGGASLARTTAVVKKIEEIALGTPGVARAPAFAGFSGATRTLSTSATALFPVFQPWPERGPKGLTNDVIVAELRKRLSVIDEAFVVILQPPRVPGIGTGGGFEMRLEDRASRGTDLLVAATQDLVAAANMAPGIAGVSSPFSTNTPQLFVNIDRARAQMLAVPIDKVSDAIETYFDSTYVNHFNILCRTYQVTAQADFPFREDASDLARVRTRSDRGEMVPLGSVVQVSDRSGPERVPRYNLYPTTEIKGEGLPGISSTKILATMDRLATDILPSGISFEWTTCPISRPRRAVPDSISSRSASCCLSGPGRAIWRLDPAALDPADRPDVPAGGQPARPAAGPGRQCADPDRLHRAGRPGGEERHPDRRIRQAAGGRRQGADCCRAGSLPPAAAAHPDDILRLHPGRSAAGPIIGRRVGDAAGRGHGGVLRNAGRHFLRPDLHPDLLCHHPRPDRRGPSARSGGGAGRSQGNGGASSSGAIAVPWLRHGQCKMARSSALGCRALRTYCRPIKQGRTA